MKSGPCSSAKSDVYGESGQMREKDWLAPAAIDQRTLYQGNTVLRGGQIPIVESKSSAKPATNR
jgi:hypothetical protein